MPLKQPDHKVNIHKAHSMFMALSDVNKILHLGVFSVVLLGFCASAAPGKASCSLLVKSPVGLAVNSLILCVDVTS